MQDHDPNLAEPAKASSRKGSRKRWRGIPPWIRARLDEEQRLKAEAARMGIDPRSLLRPNSPELRRVLSTTSIEFSERQVKQQAESERSLPF